MGISGLGPLLVKEGLLSEQDRMIIGKSSGLQSWAFAKGVIASGLLDEDELASFLAERTRFQVAPKNFVGSASPEALTILDINLMTMLEVYPIKVTKQSLTVAMVDPLDKSVLRQLEFFTGLRVRPVIASLSAIYAGLRQLNPKFVPPQSDLEKFFFNHAPAAFQQQRLREPHSGSSSAASLLPKEDVIRAFRPPVVQKTETRTQTIESPSLDFSGSEEFRDLPSIDGDDTNLDELAASDDIAISELNITTDAEPSLDSIELTEETSTEEIAAAPEASIESTQDPNNILDSDDDLFKSDDSALHEPVVEEKLEAEPQIETPIAEQPFEEQSLEELSLGNTEVEESLEDLSFDTTETEEPITDLSLDTTEAEEPLAGLSLDATEIEEPLAEQSIDNTEVLAELADLGNGEEELSLTIEDTNEETLGDLSPAAMKDFDTTENDLVFEESFADDTAVLDVAAANQSALQESIASEEDGMSAFAGSDDSLKIEDDNSEEMTELSEPEIVEDDSLVIEESETDLFLADEQKTEQEKPSSTVSKARRSIDDEVDSLLTDQEREHLAEHNEWDQEGSGARVYMHPAMGDLNQSLLYLSMATTTAKAMDVTARGLMPVLSRGVLYQVAQRKIVPTFAWEGHEAKTDLKSYQTPKLTSLLASITPHQWQVVELKEQGFMFWQDNEHKMVATRFGDLNEGLLVIGHFKQSCFLVEGFQQTTLNLCRELWNRMEHGLDEEGRMVVD